MADPVYREAVPEARAAAACGDGAAANAAITKPAKEKANLAQEAIEGEARVAGGRLGGGFGRGRDEPTPSPEEPPDHSEVARGLSTKLLQGRRRKQGGADYTGSHNGPADDVEQVPAHG